MTTVAFDGKTLAADRRMGGYMNVGKIFKLPDGSLLAGAGYYDQIVEVATWLTLGRDEAQRPGLPDGRESEFIWITPKGVAHWLTWPWLRPVRINEAFAAAGSGSQFALGAMAAGASAKRAVEIASKYDEATGKGVDVVEIVKPAKRK